MDSEGELQARRDDIQAALDGERELLATRSNYQGRLACVEALLDTPTEAQAIDLLRTAEAKSATYYSWVRVVGWIPGVGDWVRQNAHYYDGMKSCALNVLDAGPIRETESGESIVTIDGQEVSLSRSS